MIRLSQRAGSDGRKTKEDAVNDRFDLEERLLDYTAQVIRLVQELPKTRAGNLVADCYALELLLCESRQRRPLSRSRTSSTSSRSVTRNCVSPNAGKLIERVPLLDVTMTATLRDETDQLIRIFRASIRTASGETNDDSRVVNLKVLRAREVVEELSTFTRLGKNNDDSSVQR